VSRKTVYRATQRVAADAELAVEDAVHRTAMRAVDRTCRRVDAARDREIAAIIASRDAAT
jgi:hypothetical protein